MRISPKCNACGGALDEPGAIILGPPEAIAHLPGRFNTRKYQLCLSCFRDHFVVFGAMRWTVEHSLECRLSGAMAECEVHTQVEAWVEASSFGIFDALTGRWRVRGFDEYGTPALDAA